MNRSKIEWCDYTWNPVTGCKHDCPYCYARVIANRFKPQELQLMNIADCRPIVPISKKNLGCYECDLPVQLTDFSGKKLRTTPYPQGFKPTFHKYRLDEPVKKTKGVKIFVCSMADLFGEWVPMEWIKSVLKTCEAAPQHTFIFLTKNPRGVQGFDFPANCWCGTSVENQEKADERIPELLNINCRTLFVSYEPALGPVDFAKWLKEKKELSYKDDGIGHLNVPYFRVTQRKLNWLIVGVQTGPGAKEPDREWIWQAIEQANAANVPVFVKDNVKRYTYIREFPGVTP